MKSTINMKKSTFLLLFLISITVFSQSTHSPTLYVKSFHQELLKFESKNQRYYLDNVLNNNRTRIANRYDAVLSQLKNSRQDLTRMSDYKLNDDLKKSYVIGFDSLISTYTIEFAKVEHLRKYSTFSYKQLKDYNNALLKAEQKVQAAKDILKNAEQDFAAKYKARLNMKNINTLQNHAFLKTSVHFRTINESFVKIDGDIRSLVYTLENAKPNELNKEEVTFILDSIKENLNLLHATLEETEIEGGLLNDNLLEETNDYLKATTKDTKKVLAKIALKIISQKPTGVELQNAMIDIKFFRLDYDIVREEFLEDRNRWVVNTFRSIYKATEAEDLNLTASR